MSLISIAIGQDVIDSVKIPPRPDILNFVYREINKEAPDIKEIANKVAEDGGLFSSILKLINSPYFGLRCQIHSVSKAITLIGLDNFAINIAGIKMRSELSNSGFAHLPDYWNLASETANLSGMIARELGITSVQEAYVFGLFKDAGIPILAARNPEEYPLILQYQQEQDQQTLTQIEDERLDTNHCVIGYLMMKKWGMKKHLREACLYHHDLEFITDDTLKDDQRSRLLIVIAKLAKHFALCQQGKPSKEWDKLSDFIPSYLGLSKSDITDLQHQLNPSK